MAKGLRETANRVRSVKNTAQITRAMQLVASSKMRRAQDTALSGRDYGQLFIDILDTALARLDETAAAHPLLQKREVRTRGILVVSTDRGLCGALNTNLFRLLSDIPAGAACFAAIGAKAAQFLSRSGRRLLLKFPAPDQISFSNIRQIGNHLIQRYLDGAVDTVEILHPRFRNTLVQEPVLFPVLPITDVREIAARIRSRVLGNPPPGARPPALAATLSAAAADGREIAFDPSPGAVFADLPQLYVKHVIYHAVLEAKASEHSARMVAMKSATDNAAKITEALTLEYNKARQAAITNEISEITAAALAH
jgi:F-type H+-transporting ATPase subunit gamma